MKKIFYLTIILISTLNLKAQIPNNPILHYSFNGNTNDASGNNLNGTNNGASLDLDRFGNSNNAYNFDGVGDFIELPSNISLQPTFPFTLSMWIKIENTGSGVSSFVYSSDESPSWYSGFYLGYTNDARIGIGYGNNQGHGPSFRKSFTCVDPVSLNEWHQITAIFYSETSGEIFVDCKSQITTEVGSATNMAYSNVPGAIGRALDQHANSYHDGQIDNVRLYDYPIDTTDLMYFCYESPCTYQVAVYDTTMIYDTVTVYDTIVITDTVHVGVTSIESTVIKVFANPASEVLFIIMNKGDVGRNYYLELINILGQTVLRQELISDEDSIDVSMYTKGNYILRIKDDLGEVKSNQKIVLN